MAHVAGAALLELLPAGAWAGVVAPGLEAHRGVDEVPVPAVVHEGRALAVAVLAVVVVPARREGVKLEDSVK